MRQITILDDGCGVPQSMHEKIFEPRVTSKLDTMSMDRWGVHGRGMALFSIKSNTSQAKIMQSGEGMGSSMYIAADTELLPEKTDQSTIPQVERDDDGNLTVMRGPHNINRKVLEFALDNRHEVEVYLGSPAEIVATLIEFGEKQMDNREMLFVDSPEDLPVCHRLAVYESASDLMQRCAALGLNISERTAHRIIHDQISPVKAFYKVATAKKSKASSHGANIYKDCRALKVSKEDIGMFSRKLEDAFEAIAPSYYISLAEEPKIKIGKDSIQVTFKIDKE